MSLIEALIDSLQGDASVREASASRNWIAVWSRHCGLASTLGSGDDATTIDVAGLAGRSARDLARLALSDDPLDAALGMAAVNSLIEVDESRCEERNGRNIILECAVGKSVALVGHFPFVPELREVARELSVLELRPRPGDLPSTEAPQRIPEAEVVAITGTAFVNHTIEPLLSYCRPDALIIIIGPTAPLSPLLFDYGVDLISGARVSDPPLVLRQVAEGVDFRHMRGIRRLTLRRPFAFPTVLRRSASDNP